MCQVKNIAVALLLFLVGCVSTSTPLPRPAPRERLSCMQGVQRCANGLYVETDCASLNLKTGRCERWEDACAGFAR